MAGFGLGMFFGGMQEGIKDRRDYELKQKKDLRDDAELELNKKRVGLAAAEFEQRKSEFSQRLAFDTSKEANDVRLRGYGLSLQERTVAVQEQAQRNAQQRELQATVDQENQRGMQVVTQTIASARAIGKSPEEALNAVAPILDGIKRRADLVQLNGDLYVNQARALAAAPSPGETAAASGRAEATKKIAETSELVGAGVSQSVAAQTSGMKGVEPKNIEYRTFKMPDGSFKSVRADDKAGGEDLLAKGGISTPVSVQASKIGDLSVNMPDEKEVSAARKALRQSQSDVSEINRTIEEFKKNPAAAGITGHLIEKIGGLTQQIPLIGPAAVKAAEGVSGVKLEDVTKTRTEAILSIGKAIRLVTQDPSRFSEGDRKLTENAVKALDPSASNDQVVAALNTIQAALKRTSLSDAADTLRVAAKIEINDLKTDAGINKLGKILMNNGMNADQAIEAIDYLMKRNGLH